jgi:predicted acylesterase/phospholipase RssA
VQTLLPLFILDQNRRAGRTPSMDAAAPGPCGSLGRHEGRLDMARPFKVLSVDGGGIRGIIPALVLTEVERRTGRRIATLFDLIAGTSTGGIIALGLTKPDESGAPEYSAQEIAELYSGRGEKIFSSSILHQLSSAWGVLDEKYPATEVEKVFDDYFGEARLKDALTNVLVTAFEIELRRPWFFRSTKAKAEPEYDFPMKKVARATSAAPTYFEPLRLEGEGEDRGKHWALVDGGVYANNPAICALVDARTTHNADDVLILSLGTGEPTEGLPWKDAKDWGLVGWARPLLDIVFEGVSDTVGYQVEQLCPPVANKPRSLRLQVQLPHLKTAIDDIDDATKATIEALKGVAERLIRENDKKLDDICRELTAEPTS